MILENFEYLVDELWNWAGNLDGSSPSRPVNDISKMFSNSSTSDLAGVIYDRFHCRRLSPDPAVPIEPAEDQLLILMKIFEDRKVESIGWEPTQLDWYLSGPTTAIVRKSGVHLEVERRSASKITKIMVPALRARYTKGYAAILSPRGIPVSGIRIYMNTDFTNLRNLVPAIVSVLDTLRVRWILKFLTDASEYPRSDSIVIYLQKSAAHAMISTISEISRPLGKAGAPTSTFAKRCGNGVGWMEANGGVSAGMQRSISVACGLREWITGPRGEKSSRDRLRDRLNIQFVADGIEANRPYLLLQRSSPINGAQ